MKILHFLLLLALISFPLSAEVLTKRVLITKTSKTSNLKKIKAKLDTINVQMYIVKKKNVYLIYSAKYKDEVSLKKVYRRIKKYFNSAVILTSNNVKKQIPNKKVKKEVTKPKVTTKKMEKRMEQNVVTDTGDSINTETINKNILISFGMGLGNIAGDTTDIVTSKLANSGLSYSLEATYSLYEYLSISAAYQSISTGDIAINNFYTTANFTVDIDEDIGLYSGLLLGQGSLKLSNSTPSSAMLKGIQIGLSYKVYNGVELFSSYQGISTGFTIGNGTSAANFDFIHNFQAGLGYRF